MIYICKVSGCRSNSSKNNDLQFFVFPETRQRLKLWLNAICPNDQLHSATNSLSLRWRKKFRVCSLHFLPTSIRHRKLIKGAIPTLNLPTIKPEKEKDDNPENIVCESCSMMISKYDTIYRCIVCGDYDLCRRCERYDCHPDHHYFIRFNHPVLSTVEKALFQRIRSLSSNTFEQKNQIKTSPTESDSDDEPITKYQKNTNIDLEISNNDRNKITTEVNRVLKLVNKKRKPDSEKPSKVMKKVKRNIGIMKEISTQTPMESETSESAHEVEFADVNDFKNEKHGEDTANEGSQLTFLKTEMDSMLSTMLT